MGKKAYNNGKQVIFLEEGAAIPEGFIKGGLAFRSKESYMAGGKKSAVTQQQQWQDKSESEKEEWSNRCKEFHLQRSEEQIKERVAKALETMSHKSEEELLSIKLKKSNSLKAFWESQTDEYKIERMSKVNSNGGGWNKDTIKATVQERYGVANVAQLDEVKEKSKQALTETCQERYGVEWACQLPQCYNAIGQHSADSQPNRVFKQLLDEADIENSTEFVLGKYRFDFKVNNTLIEINPYVTHNSTWGIFGNKGLAKDYHLNKTREAEKAGYRCIHVFDWDDLEKIISQLKEGPIVAARKCNLKVVEDKNLINTFLVNNHLQGKCRGTIFACGLFDKQTNELLELMTFGKPRYSTKYEWELLRLCTKRGYRVIGGSERLFKFFIDMVKPATPVISYCDRSKFRGEVYSKLGFESDHNLKPLLHWYNPKTQKHFTDAYLTKHGFDRLLGKEYGTFGKGTSNRELMLNNGFVEIYDCGQQSFIFNLKMEALTK